MLIDVYSHSVVVRPNTGNEKRLVLDFTRRLIQWDTETDGDGNVVHKVMKVFAYDNHHEQSFRFHINLLKDFSNFMDANASAMQRENVAVTVHKAKLSPRFMVPYKVKNLFDPREDQVPVIEHLLSRKDPAHIDLCGYKIPLEDNNKTITLRTGGGKTFITKYVMAKEGVRVFIMMRGGFLDRWIPDMDETFVLKGSAIQVIQGSNSLSAAMENALDGLSDGVQIYLASTDTFVEYLGHYEKNGVSETYPIAPNEFFDRLGIGSTVIDEGHQMPHRIMKFFSYLHVYKHTTLTATLDTMDKFMDKILTIMYPKEARFSGPKVDPHIHATAFHYKLANKRRVKYTGWKGSYNHTALESSLMLAKNRDLFKEYIEMVEYLLKTRYVKRNLKGTKAIVFFATIDMCTKVTKELQKKLPGYKVARYISKDKMDVMDDADIIISTVLSAGTAVDIPNLLTSIMTTAIDSQQSNEQTVGRTRPVKLHPDENPEFIYFVCQDIDKHLDYHGNKLKFFKDKVKSHENFFSDYNLGHASESKKPGAGVPPKLDRIAGKPPNNWWKREQNYHKRKRNR